MFEDIESAAKTVLDYLGNQSASEDFQEIMKLKISVGMSSSKLFLALGWLLREGKVDLQASEYGYKVRCRVRESKNQLDLNPTTG